MCCRWSGGFGMIGMTLGILLILALIVGGILLVIWLVKRSEISGKKPIVTESASSALEFARERYAKGEISREEFQNIVSELEKR